MTGLQTQNHQQVHRRQPMVTNPPFRKRRQWIITNRWRREIEADDSPWLAKMQTIGKEGLIDTNKIGISYISTYTQHHRSKVTSGIMGKGWVGTF